LPLAITIFVLCMNINEQLICVTAIPYSYKIFFY
jgi:hypothetical protein